MIIHLIRPFAVLCSLMTFFWLFFAAMGRDPASEDPMPFTFMLAIVAVIPTGLVALGLCFAKKDGGVF